MDGRESFLLSQTEDPVVSSSTHGHTLIKPQCKSLFEGRQQQQEAGSALQHVTYIVPLPASTTE